MSVEEKTGMTQELDVAKVEEFAGKMVGVLNDAMLALMTSIGHQAGLFDTMAKLPPATSDVIAGAVDLNERYVREWLGAMVVGGVVNYDPDQANYHLPPEHAACLTRAAGPDNLASPSRSSSRCSATSKAGSSSASATVAAYRTQRTGVSRNLWPRTAPRSTARP